jgi:molecular chaperone DnaK (HSP70)
VRSKHGLTWENIDDVIAVGGSTRMPQIIRSIEKVTGKQPNCSLPPSEAIAHGAAIHAATCVVNSKPFWKGDPSESEPDRSELTAASHSETPAAGPAPDPETEEVTVRIDAEVTEDDGPEAAGADALDPDRKPASPFDEEVVERLRKIRKQDVNAHSLGVRARMHSGKKRNSIIIPRNTPLPATRTKQYGTKMNGQTRVHVRILQGESRHVSACIEVGDCRIENLPAGLPKGSPVDVTFVYDGNGLLQVRAVEPTSGREASTTIRRTTGLDQGSVRRATLKIKRISVL